MADTKLLCPKCGSDQLTSNKKGFSGKKAVAGAVLTGGVGLLAGTIGSNKIKITCLSCGLQFKPGQGATSQQQVIEKKKADKSAGKWALIILGALLLFGALSKWFGGDKSNKTEQKQNPITGSFNDLKNPEQSQFISNIMTYVVDKQDLTETDISSNVDKIVSDYFQQLNNKISNWQGKVLDVHTDEKGNYMTIQLEAGQLNSEILECSILVNQVDDTKDKNNLLKKGTDIISKAKSTQTNQNVNFSANIISLEPTEVKKSDNKISITTKLKVRITELN